LDNTKATAFPLAK